MCTVHCAECMIDCRMNANEYVLILILNCRLNRTFACIPCESIKQMHLFKKNIHLFSENNLWSFRLVQQLRHTQSTYRHSGLRIPRTNLQLDRHVLTIRMRPCERAFYFFFFTPQPTVYEKREIYRIWKLKALAVAIISIRNTDTAYRVQFN